MTNNASRKTQTSAPISRRRSQRRSRLPPGTVIVRYRELLAPVQTGTQQFLFVPGSSGLVHLDARGRMYEMYRLRGPVKVQYKAAVGTTVNGEVLIGVDYDAKDAVLTYSGTAALSPKAMSPVWRDCTLSVPHNRAMKQRWLVTANDIAPAANGGMPTNFREDCVAFGLMVTSTGEKSTGSIWVEYNVEFASPRVPEPLVNRSAVNNTNSIGPKGHTGFTCPVAPGQSFYIYTEQGSLQLGDGYTQAATGTTDGVNWTLVNRALTAASDTWGTLTGLTNTIGALMCSESLKALVNAVKSILP